MIQALGVTFIKLFSLLIQRPNKLWSLATGQPFLAWRKYNKIFYSCNLPLLLISQSVLERQAFLFYPNVCE